MTERACGAATPSFPIAAEPPSLRRDRRRKDGASRRPSNSSCGSESSRRWCARRPRRSLADACLADQAAEQAVIAAEADWLGRVPPGGAPAKQPARRGDRRGGGARTCAADAPAACAFRRPVRSRSIYSHLRRSSTSRQRPDNVQTASRQCPDSVQTAKSERLDSYTDSNST